MTTSDNTEKEGLLKQRAIIADLIKMDQQSLIATLNTAMQQSVVVTKVVAKVATEDIKLNPVFYEPSPNNPHYPPIDAASVGAYSKPDRVKEDMSQDTIQKLVSILNRTKELEIRDSSDEFKAHCIDKLTNVLSLGLLKIIEKSVGEFQRIRNVAFYKASNGNEFYLEYSEPGVQKENNDPQDVVVTGFSIPAGATFIFDEKEKTKMTNSHDPISHSMKLIPPALVIATTPEEALKLGRGGYFATPSTPADLAVLQNAAAQSYKDAETAKLYKDRIYKSLSTIIDSVADPELKESITKNFVEKYARENNLVILEPTADKTTLKDSISKLIVTMFDDIKKDHPTQISIISSVEDELKIHYSARIDELVERFQSEETVDTPVPVDDTEVNMEMAPPDYPWSKMISEFTNDPLRGESQFRAMARDPLKVLKEFRILTLNGPRQTGKTQAALEYVGWDPHSCFINATSLVSPLTSHPKFKQHELDRIRARTLDIRKHGINDTTFKNVKVLVINQDGYPLDKFDPLREVLHYYEENFAYFHPDFKIVMIG